MGEMMGITGGNEALPRPLPPSWDKVMIAASIAVSLLGAFTSTQLMCQARASVYFSHVFIWTLLGSLTFGFCSIWSLHFVAMLGCELDLPIGIDVPLTILSSILAVAFTFAALASDLLVERYHRQGKHRNHMRKRGRGAKRLIANPSNNPCNMRPNACSEDVEPEEEDYSDNAEDSEILSLLQGSMTESDAEATLRASSGPDSPPTPSNSALHGDHADKFGAPSPTELLEDEDSSPRPSSVSSETWRSASITGSTHSSHALANILDIAHRSTAPAGNAFKATGEALYTGCTVKNVLKGFLWSLAITGMHYVGIAALKIPNGFFTLNPILVVLSGLISWVVCLVGVILMSRIETRLTQQFLFSVVASTGVAAMHFTGMAAATFWSYDSPSESRGYPPALASAIVTIAITTCIAANFLLAHVATLSRNKLAEIVLTRKELWKTIAQKENAEQAAAAKSDFIASASHEIRTPLHHLQGYSDLLARTELTEEGRLLLYAIQHATKTLSLITNNVLDWSKLERHAEAACRPISLNMRTVCESILMLLPNRDDAEEVDLMVVVSPDVPHSLFLDETYIHRILMNLLSNALKFTRSGYILLLVELDGDTLVSTVKDTGSGIPPSFLPQLFEPFTQAQVRGSQRGTGLGLSIIKQLLHKMQGTIQVDSNHTDTADIGPRQTGSTFTTRIPVQLSDGLECIGGPSKNLPSIAVIRVEDARSLQGVCTAWEVFGYDVTIIQDFSNFHDNEWKYIWVDLDYLKANPVELQRLLDQGKTPVLVPYDTQDSLKELPEVQSTARFVTIQKPLIWHSFEQRIASAKEPSNNILTKAVSFAPTVEVLDREYKDQLHDEPMTKQPVILLVEDNPINQKLGKKMLSALRYNVLTADDGEDAIKQILTHDDTIDAIVMDQSMPRKDGVTATKEIRAMETRGRLSRRRPIIALTAVVSAEAQALFKAAGADDFLTKPLSLDQLRQTLAVHLPE